MNRRIAGESPGHRRVKGAVAPGTATSKGKFCERKFSERGLHEYQTRPRGPQSQARPRRIARPREPEARGTATLALKIWETKLSQGQAKGKLYKENFERMCMDEPANRRRIARAPTCRGSLNIRHGNVKWEILRRH